MLCPRLAAERGGCGRAESCLRKLAFRLDYSVAIGRVRPVIDKLAYPDW